MDNLSQFNFEYSPFDIGANSKLSVIDDDVNAGYPKDKCIHHFFEEQVKKTPDNIAVVLDDRQLTYKQLDEKSNQLARFLQKKGVKPETMVAICLDRSLEIIIAILAILKSGGAYVPIDPDYPEDRIFFMLSDSACPILITQKSFKPMLLQTNTDIIYYDETLHEIATESIERVESGVKPHNLAYVIYTSGSTGKPKGVLIENKNVVRLLFNEQFQFDFNEDDVWTIFHSFCFDFSVWEMYGALLYGGKAVIVPKKKARDPQAFAKIILSEKVTVINQTPSAFYHLIPKLFELSCEPVRIRYIIFGGEKLNPNKLGEVKTCFPHIRFINMYGITETTVHVTYKEITQKDIEKGFSNIGKPIPTLSVYVVDENLRVVPAGIEGELCVGGTGVARGYLNRQELTAEKFIQNPYNPEEILYRSGDLACICENGDLEYFGRMDHQVQLRGFRIELGEVESVIMTIEEVEDCAVIPHEDSTGEVRLVAYVIFKKAEVAFEKIRARVSKQLPDYMIPSFFIKMDRFPLTSNGKLEIKRLPAPDIAVISMTDYVAPKSETAVALLSIFRYVLGFTEDKIGLKHNFFEIGGHSLVAAAIAEHIRIKLHKDITIRHIYENPNIGELAKVIEKLDKIGNLSDEKQTRNEASTVGVKQHETKKDELQAVNKQFTPDLSISSQCIGEIQAPSATSPLLSAQLISWLLKCFWKVKSSNVCEIYTLTGIFDFGEFQHALNAIAKRHDSLWWRFSPKTPLMEFQKPFDYELELIDISNTDGKQKDELFNQWILKILHTPFDLTQTPLFRMAAIKSSEDSHFLLVSFPHIIADSASLNAFVHEIFSEYLPSKEHGIEIDSLRKVSAFEQVCNERAYLESEAYRGAYRFWEEKLENSEFLAFKETYFLRRGDKTGKKLLAKIKVHQEVIDELEKLSLKTNASVQMIILAAIQATLHTLSGQSDISVTMICDARGIHAYPPVMNLNAAVIVVRSEFLPDMTYLDLLTQIKWFIIDALNHLKFPSSIMLTIPFFSILKKKPLASLLARVSSAVSVWYYRKGKVNKDVMSALISYMIGTIFERIDVKRKKISFRLAPPIVYNVMPNFYENRVLWSSDKLSVTDFRKRDLIINPKVFEENSVYNDAKVLNCDLIRDENSNAFLCLWGGGFNGDFFLLMEEVFLGHLKKMVKNPSDPIEK